MYKPEKEALDHAQEHQRNDLMRIMLVAEGVI